MESVSEILESLGGVPVADKEGVTIPDAYVVPVVREGRRYQVGAIIRPARGTVEGKVELTAAVWASKAVPVLEVVTKANSNMDDKIIAFPDEEGSNVVVVHQQPTTWLNDHPDRVEKAVGDTIRSAEFVGRLVGASEGTARENIILHI